MITAADLAPLKQLAKALYSWPFQDTTIWRQRDLLREFARITRSLPLSLEWWTKEQLDICIDLCAVTGARVCLQVSPQFANNGAKAGDWSGAFATLFSAWTARLAIAAVQMQRVVGAVCIDSEAWKVPPAGQASIADVAAKHALIRQTVNAYFPAAQIIEFSRGGTGFSGQAIADAGHYPRGASQTEPAENYSVPLYYQEWAANQDCYRATLANADADGVKDVIPFISLGGCQPRTKNAWGDFNYGVQHNWAYQAGLEVFNKWAEDKPQFPDFERASCAYLWPAAFVNDAAGSQLIELVKGAAGQ